MVLESLVNPRVDERHPRIMMVYGFVYSTVGLFLAMQVFGNQASMSAVFLTTMPLIIVMYNAIKLEVSKECLIHKELFLLKEHTHILWFFLYLFLGMTIAYSLWFTVLSPETSRNVFMVQLDTIKSITGRDITPSGAVVHGSERLYQILANNFRVLFLCILFSFIYGSGAIFILTWNASVVGVAIGGSLREVAGLAGIQVGLSYLVHGLPEIAAYFLAALAGGIISVALAHYEYHEEGFKDVPALKHIFIDSVDLIIASILVLVVAALIEVYITPNFF